jgi:hypothetical protein
LISRTVSDDDAHCGDIDDRSVRAFAVKPAPSRCEVRSLGSLRSLVYPRYINGQKRRMRVV